MTRDEPDECSGEPAPAPVRTKRPSARAMCTLTVPVRCTPAEKENWARAAGVMDTTLAEVAREAWNRLYVSMLEEEKKIKRWSKR